MSDLRTLGKAMRDAQRAWLHGEISAVLRERREAAEAAHKALSEPPAAPELREEAARTIEALAEVARSVVQARDNLFQQTCGQPVTAHGGTEINWILLNDAALKAERALVSTSAHGFNVPEPHVPRYPPGAVGQPQTKFKDDEIQSIIDGLERDGAFRGGNEQWRMQLAANALRFLRDQVKPPAALAEIDGLARKVRLLAEDDLRAMRRDVMLRSGQFVDELDLTKWADAMDEAATALENLSARVGELDAALAEIGCGYYADRDAPWRLDRVVNIARAVRNRLPWEPIAELKVTEEEKARGEGLVSRAEAAEARAARLEAALREIRAETAFDIVMRSNAVALSSICANCHQHADAALSALHMLSLQGRFQGERTERKPRTPKRRKPPGPRTSPKGRAVTLAKINFQEKERGHDGLEDFPSNPAGDREARRSRRTDG